MRFKFDNGYTIDLAYPSCHNKENPGVWCKARVLQPNGETMHMYDLGSGHFAWTIPIVPSQKSNVGFANPVTLDILAGFVRNFPAWKLQPVTTWS